MIKQNLINERQDVEEIKITLNNLRNMIDDVKDLIVDCRDEDGNLDNKAVSTIKKSYKETLKKILQIADLDSKYYDLTLDERIK